ncbi:MAG TPA: serine hydrolase domain-containing protein, partial [Tepidisphaeraceae bacterium]|nr:serine hydrolase domain-containing protein [Tepidisphaeraceae bacterium]
MPESPVINDAMRPFVEKRELSGLVTLVANNRDVLHLSAIGRRDLEQDLPMQTDTIFWVASMTKLITASAIMMLGDEGKLEIQDRVSKFIPEFEKLKTPTSRPANITLWHLITHTSGLAEVPEAQARKAPLLKDLIPTFLALPMKFEPGAKWDYCQSSINTLGRIIEIISGQPYDEFLQHRFFNPLGMKDATFYPSKTQMKNMAIPYRLDNGKLLPSDIKLMYGPVGDRSHFPAANGGLFCTAADYCRFAQMLLNNGELNGHRYVSPNSVQEMTRPQTGKMEVGFV